MNDTPLLPRISIVTPSYNQGQFLEETIMSVLSQEYPDLEYVIMDGGSSDNSAEVIRKYEHRLKHWVSEPDKGQYDAINKGFAQTSGEIMGYLNSDDKYAPWCFNIIGEVFAAFPEVEWLTSCYPLSWDERGRATNCGKLEGFSRQAFFQGRNLPRGDKFSTHFVQQESTFWRRSLWERAGGYVHGGLRLAGDYELWARFWSHEGILYAVTTPLGGFRNHQAQKMATGRQEYFTEGEGVLIDYGGSRPGVLRQWLSFFLRGLPQQILKRLRFLGVAYTAKILSYRRRDGRWEALDTYFA